MSDDMPPVAAGLVLYNTLTRRKEPFHALHAPVVKMFTCGPSVYRRAHLGNFRTFLFEDLLQRHLEYLGYQVERVINFTDVEDKAIAEAHAQGVSLSGLVEPVEEEFQAECARLGIELPATIQRASAEDNVDRAVSLIELLMERGYAYRHKGDIFYDPLQFDGFGRLYGLDMSQWPDHKVRFSKDTYPGQRWNLGDFILWHAYEPADGEVFWETELGKGRPAWNIQDAAIITRHLGYRIDIHCGGVDNLFRHHDYTLAIVEAATCETFASFWLHGEHLLVDGAKMSKSRGNIIHSADLREEGVDDRDLRHFLLGTHYREKLNFTRKGLAQAATELRELRRLAAVACEPDPEVNRSSKAGKQAVSALPEAFTAAMNDDLDYPAALRGLREGLGHIVDLRAKRAVGVLDSGLLGAELKRMDTVLGVLFDADGRLPAPEA